MDSINNKNATFEIMVHEIIYSTNMKLNLTRHLFLEGASSHSGEVGHIMEKYKRT